MKNIQILKIMLVVGVLATATMDASAGAPRALAPMVRVGSDQSYSSAHFQPIDWNGDGLLDIVQLGNGNCTGWVYLNYGAPDAPLLRNPDKWETNFTETSPVSFGELSDVFICDFDGDGDLDIVVAAGFLAVVFNVGDRWNPGIWPGRCLRLQNSATFPKHYLTTPEGLVRREIATICCADANGDGQPDIYINLPDDGGLLLQTNARQGTNFALNAAVAVKDSDGVAVCSPHPYPCDLNGDGVLDLISTTPTNGVWVHLGVKGSNGVLFQRAVQVVDKAGQAVAGGNKVAVADWDGDGALDLMVVDDTAVIRCRRQIAPGKLLFASAAQIVRTSGLPHVEQGNILSFIQSGEGGFLGIRGAHDMGCWWSKPWISTLANGWGHSRCGFNDCRITLNDKDLALSVPAAILSDFDGDGLPDIVAWQAKEQRLQLFRGQAAMPRVFNAQPELLLEVPELKEHGGIKGVAAGNWSGDKVSDLLVLTAQKGALFIYRNIGEARSPRFAPHAALTSAGEPLVGLGSFTLHDWDGDGRVDLLANVGTNLFWYRNVGDPTNLQAAKPIPCQARVFECNSLAAGDLDRDGVPDLFHRNYLWDWKGDEQMYLAHEEIWWHRGLAADAPEEVADLTVEGATKREVTLRWTMPRGAVRSELRWLDEPINEVNWPCATITKVKIKADPATGRTTARVSGLDAGRTYWFGVCAFSAGGARSAVSHSPAAATLPRRRLELVEGVPSVAPDAAPYHGCTNVTLRANSPPAPYLTVGNNAALVTFDLSALAGRKPQRTRLMLQTFGPYGGCDGRMLNTPVRGRPVRGEFDLQKATATMRNGTDKWQPADFGPGLPNLSPSASEGILEWDVTEAVAWALANGRSLTVFLDRSPVARSVNYKCYASDAADWRQRPRLTLEYHD